MSDWGKGVINDIGWGQGANNDIGWGSIYDKSNAGETLLKSDLNIDAFIIEVDTTKAGTPSDQFQFTGAVGDYDVVAKQNDTQVATFNDLSGQETITLPSSGIYVLEVIPKEVNGFNRIQFNNGGDKLKITDIKQWGDVVWSSFENAFDRCSNMIVTATDVPDLSNVTSMRFMFYIINRNADPLVTDWDTSNVTNMYNLFRNIDAKNLDVSNWDVGNVTNMNNMFQNNNGNPDVSNWDVSSLVQASSMFRNASNANPDCKDWTPTSLVDGSNMFTGTNMSIQNLTDVYTNWSQLTLQQNAVFGAADTQYFESGQAGKDILVNTYNWTITDGGQV